MAEKISAPRGTHDVLPDNIASWHYVENTLREVAARFGYREIRFPTFEHTELFLRGVGDTTDVVQKEMYTFEDKGGRSITLRPEGTASVVRSYIENSLYAGALPLKVYYIAPNFRYEKPQAGRLREHHQFGAECFGSPAPQADAEVIALADTFMNALGITNIALRLNSIGCPVCRPSYHEALRSFFEARQDKLCTTCRDRMTRNPLRILDCKNPDCAALVKTAPVMLDYLCEDCQAHQHGLEEHLKAGGISYAIDPYIVRGLDYYTRTVFEFTTDCIGAQSTICGGGRYDKLVETLGGPPTPALGFGSGLERLLMVMESQKALPPAPPGCDLFIATRGEQAALTATGLISHMRRRPGLRAECDLMGRSLKAQMKAADRMGARYVLVLGEEELATGQATLKDMQKSGEDLPCALSAEAIAACLRQ